MAFAGSVYRKNARRCGRVSRNYFVVKQHHGIAILSSLGQQFTIFQCMFWLTDDNAEIGLNEVGIQQIPLASECTAKFTKEILRSSQ
jgi:hypothetical protein